MAVARRGRSYLTPSARLGPSPLGGQGLMAVAPIAAGELVAIWGNYIMSTAEMWALPAELQDFPVQVWYDQFVGPMAVDEIEPVDYMNHSCEPTCGVLHTCSAPRWSRSHCSGARSSVVNARAKPAAASRGVVTGTLMPHCSVTMSAMPM